MPGCIVHNQNVPRSFELDVVIGMIQKHLEGLRIAVTDFQCVEFTLTRHDYAHDVHSEMGAGIGLEDLVSPHGKAGLGTRITLDTALVEKPQVNPEILEKCPDEFDKLFSLFLILAQWPRTRYFESKTRISEPPHQRAVPCLQLAAIGEVSMKLPTGPVRFTDLLRM